MSWLDYLVVYMIIGMAVMGVIFHQSYLAVPPRRDRATELLMIAVVVLLWLVCATLWPLYLVYAVFVYKSK